jgi:hypothetical protein
LKFCLQTGLALVGLAQVHFKDIIQEDLILLDFGG